MSVSFEGIGEQVISFYNSETTPAKAGEPVKLGGNGEVAAAGAGEKFFGVVIDGDNEHAAVQTGGYIRLSYTGASAPAAGFASLTADGDGGVKLAATGDGAREHLVIDVDTTAKKVGFML